MAGTISHAFLFLALMTVPGILSKYLMNKLILKAIT